MQDDRKILITSFEPFGLSGLFIRHANASRDVANLIESQSHDKYDFLNLPVSPEANDLLLSRLEDRHPAGIIALGEDVILGNNVRIEPYALDMPPTLNFLKAVGKQKLDSAFVKDLHISSSASGIGTYYCNSVYKTALQWSQSHDGPPVAFVHVAILGNRDLQARKVLGLLNRMESMSHSPPVANMT